MSIRETTLVAFWRALDAALLASGQPPAMFGDFEPLYRAGCTLEQVLSILGA